MSRLWKRYGELNIGGRLLRTPPMAIDYEENFSIYSKPIATIKIYNPAKATVEAAGKKGCLVAFAAGYDNDKGTRFTGEVYKHSYKTGLTSELTIECSDKSSLWTNSLVNRSFRGPVKASEVIQDILSGVGISCRLQLGEDYNYERGITFADTLSACLRRCAEDTKSRLLFKGGGITFLADQEGQLLGYRLTPKTGLLSVEETATGYKCKTLFLHDLTAGSIAQLSLSGGDATIKITKGTAKFSVYGDAGIEFEAVRL